MKIHLFQSYQGDCLLIEDATGEHRILSDGGTPGAMRDWIAEELGRIADAGAAIDLLYISHIDRDHIGGALELLDLAMQWKVYDHHQSAGDVVERPDLPRPPKIHSIWHNAFRDLIKDNAGAIEDALAASAPMFQASRSPELVQVGYEYAQIANSVDDALRVSRLIKPQLLDVPLNQLAATPAHSGKLLMARDGLAAEQIGSMRVTILCPTEEELDDLREGWNNWLRDSKNRATAREIRDEYEEYLEAGRLPDPARLLDLHSWQGVPGYKGVTVPNVASIVLLVEEGDASLLLTGDSHPDMILKGLVFAGRLRDDSIHVSALKYPHHGSEHNVSDEFPRAISADHYLFCGDGSNTNPEIEVLEQMLQSRVGSKSKRTRSSTAENRPFTFWFSTAPDALDDVADRRHMQRVFDWATSRAAKYPLFRFRLNDQAFITLKV